MKKLNSIIFIVILILSLNIFLVVQAEQPLYKFRMSGTHPVVGEATQKVNEVIEKINKETNGAIEITFYPADQLGNYTVVYEEIMRGSIEMALMSMPSEFDPKLDMIRLPYLLETYDDAGKTFSPNSFLFKNYSLVNKNLGITLLGLWVEGFSGIAIGKSVREIPSDIFDPSIPKDIQLRVPPSDVFRLIGEAMGFRTTGIPWPEIYSSLQTGIVEGYIGAPALICYEAFRDVVKAWLPANYLVECMGILINTKLYESLPEEFQKILSTNLQELATWSIDYAKRTDQEAITNLRDYGIEIIEPTPEQLHILASYVRDKVWPSQREILGDEIIEGIINDIK